MKNRQGEREREEAGMVLILRVVLLFWDCRVLAQREDYKWPASFFKGWSKDFISLILQDMFRAEDTSAFDLQEFIRLITERNPGVDHLP